ncbi:MAG: hypothetical protein ACYC3L_09445 [Gemmatimonadaceae bacterium]
MSSPVIDTAPAPAAPEASRVGDVLLRAWLTLGVVDALWACVLSLAYGRSIIQVWQVVASVAFGPAMTEGGLLSAGIGLAMHFVTAFIWAALFLAAYLRWAPLRRALATPAGIAGVSAVYGPLVWIVMSVGVIPLLTGVPAVLSLRWAIQLCGHVFFVGLPVVWSVERGSR